MVVVSETFCAAPFLYCDQSTAAAARHLYATNAKPQRTSRAMFVPALFILSAHAGMASTVTTVSQSRVAKACAKSASLLRSTLLSRSPARGAPLQVAPTISTAQTRARLTKR